MSRYEDIGGQCKDTQNHRERIAFHFGRQGGCLHRKVNVKVGKVTGQASLSTSGDVELSGGNGTVRASTSGGNVMLLNLSGSVDAKTAGNDIHAELVPSGKGKSQLTSSNGKIVLYVPETAKATITERIRIHGRWRGQKDEYNIRSDFKEDSSIRDEDEQEIGSKYILNGGGETISPETVSSDIEIKKLKKQDHRS